MAFLYNQISRKIILTLILLWGLFTIYFVNGLDILLYLLGVISLFGLYYILTESSAIFLLILLSFTTSYAFFIFLFQLNLPVFLIMIGILIVFGYLFTYTEQKIGILGNKRLIYLVLFSLITLEVFLVLSYFLINPISLSLIISITSYFFVGFCYTVLAKHTDNKIGTYILITLIAFLLVFLTSNWSGLV
jgi:hypothetical protein